MNNTSDFIPWFEQTWERIECSLCGFLELKEKPIEEIFGVKVKGTKTLVCKRCGHIDFFVVKK